MNVIYALDKSYGVARPQIRYMSDYVIGSLNLFQVSENQTKVGISTFDVQMDELLSVSDGTSKKIIKDTLGKINPGYASLDLNGVLKSVTPDMFKLDADTKGALVLMVHGKHSFKKFDEATKDQVKILQRAGIQTFVIVIGEDAEEFEDYHILVDGDARNQFNAADGNNVPFGIPNLEDFFGRLKGENEISKRKYIR